MDTHTHAQTTHNSAIMAVDPDTSIAYNSSHATYENTSLTCHQGLHQLLVVLGLPNAAQPRTKGVPLTLASNAKTQTQTAP